MDQVTISLAISAVGSLLQLILKSREAAKQAGEWTLEQEEQFTLEISQRMSQPHWQPDKTHET